MLATCMHCAVLHVHCHPSRSVSCEPFSVLVGYKLVTLPQATTITMTDTAITTTPLPSPNMSVMTMTTNMLYSRAGSYALENRSPAVQCIL